MFLMYILRRYRIDPYLLLLALTVALATLFPAHDQGAIIVDKIVYGAVWLLFFLYGAKIAPRAVWDGLVHWRLQSLVMGATFILFPLIGVLVAKLIEPMVSYDLVLGVIYLCVLPSTVQSSIAFTSIARGNVPAALCSASVSNLFGMVLTPVLVTLLLGRVGAFSLEAMKNIGMQLFLPFLLGQVARPMIGGWMAKHKQWTSLVDRGSILLVVYSAFSAGVVAGIWSRIELSDFAVILTMDTAILAFVLTVTTLMSRKLGFSKEDEIVIAFCGSKKSMASGIPMASILFPGQSLGLIVLPLMLFHQIQLFACAFLAQRYAARPDEVEQQAEPATTPA